MKLEDLNLKEDTIKFSDTLNTDIWKKDELKPQVYNKLMQIADAFIQYLDLSLDIADIQFTGSMANFNFNPDSDIDLHIVVKFDDYDINSDLLQDYFNAKKTVFNNNHDITIYGHPVELYVEDAGKPAEAGGKYSIKYDKWLKKPEKITKKIEDVKDSPKYKELVNKIQDILSSEYNSDEANLVLDELYDMRKNGLSSGGELSEENLIFKKLRSNGLIADLRDYINKNYDKSLSLEEHLIKESAEQDKEYRQLAYKLTKIIIKKITDKNTKLKTGSDGFFIDVTNDFKNTSPIISASNKGYLIKFTDMNEEITFSFGVTIDDYYGVIAIPAMTSDLWDYITTLVNKNNKIVSKLKSTYADNDEEYRVELSKYILDWAKKDFIKFLKSQGELAITSLVHECIHLIDEIRRTETYKPKEQNLFTQSGMKSYWNSPIEQNAFFQETTHSFDEWIRKNIFNINDWKTFKDFFEDFIHQYSGSFNELTNENKERLAKRAYKYWVSLKNS